VTPLRVVIADDQALVRSGFRMILAADGIEVVGEAADGEQAVAQVRRTRPDVVLMDIRMPQVDGLEATRRIVSAGSESPRVIILTTFDLDQYVYAALTVGASGFLLKDVTPEQLVAAVRLVRSGDALLAPTITRRLVERFAARGSAPALHERGPNLDSSGSKCPLGFATLTAEHGTTALRTADVPGIDIAGITVDAGPVSSLLLMQIGSTRAEHGACRC
jgi:DNA-binding NarL/FixJ family response regulator